MQQIYEIPFNWMWFRQANKYIEHRDSDELFKDEFDYIIQNMGF